MLLSTVFKFISNNLVYTLTWRRRTASHIPPNPCFGVPTKREKTATSVTRYNLSCTKGCIYKGKKILSDIKFFIRIWLVQCSNVLTILLKVDRRLHPINCPVHHLDLPGVMVQQHARADQLDQRRFSVY